MRRGILLACEMSIRRVARGCCSFPLRSRLRSKRIELSLLLRNLRHTLTVRNPEFPFAEFGEHGKQTVHWLILAESHLTRRLFGAMLRRIWALPVPGTDVAVEAGDVVLRSKRSR